MIKKSILSIVSKQIENFEHLKTDCFKNKPKIATVDRGGSKVLKITYFKRKFYTLKPLIMILIITIIGSISTKYCIF